MNEQFHVCHSCLNRRVMLQTLSGEVHEGVIMNVDERNVYLNTSGNYPYSEASISSKKANKKVNKKVKTSAFGFGREREFGFGFGRERILTLALFDILAISLFA